MKIEKAPVYKIFKELYNQKVLKHIILVGGWCPTIYKYHFNDDMLPVYSTLDVDLFIAHPLNISEKIDLHEILKNAGFIPDIKQHSLIKYLNDDFEVEFLTSERRNRESIVKIPDLNITAQALSLLRNVTSYSMPLNYFDLKINVPYPIYYIVLKILASYDRGTKQKEKSRKDILIAFELLEYFENNKSEIEKIELFAHTLSAKHKKQKNELLSIPEYAKYKYIFSRYI